MRKIMLILLVLTQMLRRCSLAECGCSKHKVAVLYDNNEDDDGDVDNDDDDEDCLTKQKIAVFFSAQQAGSNCKIEATSKKPLHCHQN